MSRNKYKDGKTRGRIVVEGKSGGCLVTRGNHPEKPPGIFHVELKELAGMMEAKRTQKLYARRKSRHAKNLQASLHAYNMYPYGVL